MPRARAHHGEVHIDLALFHRWPDEGIRDPRPAKCLDGDRQQQASIVEVTETGLPGVIVLAAAGHAAKLETVNLPGIAGIDDTDYKIVLSGLDRVPGIKCERQKSTFVAADVLGIEPCLREVIRAFEVNADVVECLGVRHVEAAPVPGHSVVAGKCSLQGIWELLIDSGRELRFAMPFLLLAPIIGVLRHLPRTR